MGDTLKYDKSSDPGRMTSFSEDQLASMKCDITKSNNPDEETESIEGDKDPKSDEESPIRFID